MTAKLSLKKIKEQLNHARVYMYPVILDRGEPPYNPVVVLRMNADDVMTDSPDMDEGKRRSVKYSDIRDILYRHPGDCNDS